MTHTHIAAAHIPNIHLPCHPCLGHSVQSTFMLLASKRTITRIRCSPICTHAAITLQQPTARASHPRPQTRLKTYKIHPPHGSGQDTQWHRMHAGLDLGLTLGLSTCFLGPCQPFHSFSLAAASWLEEAPRGGRRRPLEATPRSRDSCARSAPALSSASCSARRAVEDARRRIPGCLLIGVSPLRSKRSSPSRAAAPRASPPSAHLPPPAPL